MILTNIQGRTKNDKKINSSIGGVGVDTSGGRLCNAHRNRQGVYFGLSNRSLGVTKWRYFKNSGWRRIGAA